jgi:phosphocarrier protein HPr
MLSRVFEIQNEKGIHVRPSSIFAKTVSMHEVEVFVEANGLKVSGTDVLGLLSLEAQKGTRITVSVSGSDEVEAMDEIADLVARNFSDD